MEIKNPHTAQGCGGPGSAAPLCGYVEGWKIFIMRIAASGHLTRLSKIDGLVKSLKIAQPSFWRKPESSSSNMFWTPAYAGVTGLGLFARSSKIRGTKFADSLEQSGIVWNNIVPTEK